MKKILILLMLLSTTAFAGNTRNTEADALVSTDHSKTWSLPSVTATLDGTSNTATLTNKTISGSNNTISNIPVAAEMAQEVPTGTVNGSNVTFTLANTPVNAASVQLYQDGMKLVPTTDYTISTATITMTTAPALGQALSAVYPKH